MRLALITTWIALVLGGMWALTYYAQTPGSRADAPSDWPTNTLVDHSSDGPTLVMFAHPHCPCTRASLAELERIVAHAGGAITPWIVFYKPSTADSGWEETDLWRTAQEIPGAHVATDTDGQLAQRFGVSTSGHTLLYDTDGRLSFSGGITSARGHQGDNAGRGAVIALLNGEQAESTDAPVFGCPISTCPGN